MWFMDNIATLEIASAEGTDVGKYICQIKNDAGMRECSAFLQVLGGYSLLHYRYCVLQLAQLALPAFVFRLHPVLTGLSVDFSVTHRPLPSYFRTSSHLREDWADHSNGWQSFYLGVQSRRNTWAYHQVVQRWQRAKEWPQIPNYLFQQYIHFESLFCRQGRQGLVYFWSAQWSGGQQLHFFSWCFRSALCLYCSFLSLNKAFNFFPFSFPWKKPQHLSSCSSALSYLDRLVPPSFSRKLKETNGVLGSSVLLECKVSGTAPISVSWFQDGNEIVSGEKYEISFLDNVCALKLNALDVTDTGSYTCVAANVAGSDECSAFLTVQGQWKDTAMPSTKFFPLLFLFSGFPWFLFLGLFGLGFFPMVSFIFFFLTQTCSFSSPQRPSY